MSRLSFLHTYSEYTFLTDVGLLVEIFNFSWCYQFVITQS